jgi:conjugative transfer region protein (TIGR03750 family)
VSDTRALNHEPIALLGLTRTEVLIVVVLSAAIVVPLSGVVAMIAGVWWLPASGATLMLGGIGVGYGLATWMEQQKADTPSHFLIQTWALRVYSAPWIPKTGIYHFRRTGR